jgi:hypothetical protein
MEIADEHVRRTFSPDFPIPECSLETSDCNSDLEDGSVTLCLEASASPGEEARMAERHCVAVVLWPWSSVFEPRLGK